MKIKITETQLKLVAPILKEIHSLNEQNKTVCQTPNAQFHISVKDKKVSCAIDLPIDLDLSEKDAKLLETNIHNAMELVLAPYFKK